MKKTFSFILIAVSLISALFLSSFTVAGCGQASSSSASSDNQGVSSSVISGGNGIKCYGGVRASASGLSAKSTTGTISGYVYDAITGLPINGAHIFVGPPTLLTTTDATGAYSLSGVPTGNITVSAVVSDTTFIANQSRYVFNYQRMSIITSASKVDFKLFPLATYDNAGRGTIETTVQDANGNTVSDAVVYFGSETYKSFPELNGTYASIGKFTNLSVTAGNVIGAAGSLTLKGAYMTAPIALSAGTTATNTITIPSNQGHIAGTITPATGLTPTYALPMPPTSSGGLALWYIPNASSIDASALTYTSKVPAGSNYGLMLTSSNTTGKQLSISFISGIAVVSGETSSKNITMLEPPTSFTGSTYESGGITYGNFNWSAPVSWTPDLYIVVISFHNPGFSWWGITTTPGISVPMFFPTTVAIQATIFAVKTPAGVDLNNFNLLDAKFTNLTGLNL